MKFVLHRVEDVARKGEIAGDQHFLLFPQCILNVFLCFCQKLVLWWE